MTVDAQATADEAAATDEEAAAAARASQAAAELAQRRAATARERVAPVNMGDLADLERSMTARLDRIEARAAPERDEAGADELVRDEAGAARVPGGWVIAVVLGLVLLGTYVLNARRAIE